MNDDYNKIDEEELQRIEDKLLEEEAEREEEKMRVEGRSVFDIEKIKCERLHNNQDNKKQDTPKGPLRGRQIQ